MYPTTFAVITLSGNVLYHDIIRYEADKALHAANEPVQLWRKRAGRPPEVITDNFAVFPPEPEPIPEEKSTWIPVTFRLPERESATCSVDVIFTDGEEHHIGYHMQNQPSSDDENPQQSWWSAMERSTIPGVTHWQPLPALP